MVNKSNQNYHEVWIFAIDQIYDFNSGHVVVQCIDAERIHDITSVESVNENRIVLWQELFEWYFAPRVNSIPCLIVAGEAFPKQHKD